MKIVFWGTPEFALPALQALSGKKYAISLVITRPDELAGRKQILTPPPVKSYAVRRGLSILQPEELRSEEFKERLREADLFVVAAYGAIIPKDLVEMPRFGALNIHPSLLPRWRGPSPIQYAILSGDKETGVTIMKMDELMDHGPILAQRRVQIENHTTSAELHNKLAAIGAELLMETLPRYLAGEIIPEPQDDLKASFSKMLKKEDGRINWKKTAEEIERIIRAFTPWPGAWTILPGKEKIYRVKIERGFAREKEPPEGTPGYMWSEEETLYIKTGRGSLAVDRILIGGRKSLGGAEFLHGYPHLVGATLV